MSSRPFAPDELAVLERLCAGDWPGSDIARIQLASARYAGKTHPMDDDAESDACFDIEVDDGVPLLDLPGHSHLCSLTVHLDGDPTGQITLTSTGGVIDSFEYDWYTEEPPRGVPALDQLWSDEEFLAWNNRIEQRVALAPLAPLARLRGWRPWSRPQNPR